MSYSTHYFNFWLSSGTLTEAKVKAENVSGNLTLVIHSRDTRLILTVTPELLESIVDKGNSLLQDTALQEGNNE